jgi:predicted nuclease of predicted toxin-antitoxin system
VKILVDMNLSPAWAAFLGEKGFEAVHWTSVGKMDAADREIMDVAVAEGFVILTHDLDFAAILAASAKEKPSVVQIRAEDTRPATIGARVVQALRLTAQDMAAGALLTIDPGKTRVRILPFYRAIAPSRR